MRSALAASSRHRTTAGIGSPVPLERLLGGTDVLRSLGDFGAAAVTSITHDSRAVTSGALFCCLVGATTDGHDHAPAAVEAGAVALLVERPLAGVDVAQVVVADARAAMASVAAAFYGHPSRRLAVAGVTGTNGKTTVTYLLASVLEAAGRRAAVIGTISGVRTTPEAPELQARLAALAADGVNAVAMEVSSHALVQRRVDALWFEAVAFTNLSQDHLEYHGTMEGYFTAKASLFDPARARVGVVNADDPWGRRLLESTRLAVRPYSMADARDLALDRDGSTFTLDGHPVHLRLSGDFNVSNALAAGALARELGVGAADVAAGLGALVAVPGRFERVDGGGPVAVVVDYAHTPDGLEKVLASARGLAAGGRVIVVFGAGGDRDHAKRPAMGDVATRLADVAVLTTDNPRSEDPLAILAEVRGGVSRPEVLVVEPDRRTAIALALDAARPGDVVVVAGKGHETSQVFAGGRSVPFDDRVVARELLGT
ncbi:MAG: UDP-N-acetylmuramoyl-L-alanyl-D-glutamate--2,6-diaminopimelate ligase [Acidimicrobiia bacterium]